MHHASLNSVSGLGLAIALAGAMTPARADDAQNAVKVGYAHIGFNVSSGDLAGPAGTTPPGVQAGLDDASTVALVYERNVYGPWWIVLQGGAPPELKMVGAGAAAPLGQVGSARAWFPAVLAQYSIDGPWGTQPYVGAGVNYTFYTGERVDASYTGAFGGSSSTAKLDSSWGPVLKIGIGVPLGKNWIVDAAYSHYGIKTSAAITTATPGFGDIVRTVSLKADPDVLAVLLGYRF